MRSLLFACAFGIAAVACGDGPSNDNSNEPPSAGAGGGGAAGGGAAGGEGDRFAAIDAAIEDARVRANVAGVGLAIYDANDARVHARTFGDFAADRQVAIASASKLVSSMVIFSLIGRGLLSLDSTTGDVLGWAPPKGAITLRHLLSFTSGLAPANPCTSNPLATLAACVDVIAAEDPVAEPGARFDYGSTHLHVAGRMAEVVASKPWNDLFRETLGDPLGLPEGVLYYTAPKQAVGKINPLVAGGMRASVDDYAKLLSVAFHSGTSFGRTFAPAALFAEQAEEPFSSAVVGYSPAADRFRYGLCAWLECDTPAAGCEKVSSPGAFGFTPWLDRGASYYAILGMELARDGDDVVGFAVDLEQAIQPQIAAALAER